MKGEYGRWRWRVATEGGSEIEEETEDGVGEWRAEMEGQRWRDRDEK